MGYTFMKYAPIRDANAPVKSIDEMHDCEVHSREYLTSSRTGLSDYLGFSGKRALALAPNSEGRSHLKFERAAPLTTLLAHPLGVQQIQVTVGPDP